jgi:arylsulfatase A-like enzyme
VSAACSRLTVGISLVAGLLTCACGAPDDQRPNLLLITVDTLRPDRLACYGGEPGVGHAICGIGEGGVRYEWAIATAPSTAPSIASILTSRYARDHGVTQRARTTLDERQLTFVELLRDAGYATGAFVSNPVLLARRNLGQGFDVYDDRMTRSERNRPGVREREAAAATDAALAWVASAIEPWFLWIHFQDPHGPYDPPNSAPVADTAGAARLPVLEHHSGLRGIPAYQQIPGIYSLEAYERLYVSEIQYLDEHVSRLVQGVSAADRGVGIWLTADHGEAFGEDDYYLAHGHSVGLDQVRVPLLWHPAHDVDEGSVVEDPVSTMDIAPTILREGGVTPPDLFAGEPLRMGEGETSERILFAEHELRVGLVAGRTYYARDRVELDRAVPDAITGGTLPPIPPRTARLDSTEQPPYAPTTGDGSEQVLERRLAAFVDRRGDAVTGDELELDRDTVEALRALGYLE